MPHKGASTQYHNQVLVKPHHQPSDRDQQAREKLKQKAQIKRRVYIQLGQEALQTVHKTFALGCTSDFTFTSFSGWFNTFRFTSHIVCYTTRYQLFGNYRLLLYKH